MTTAKTARYLTTAALSLATLAIPLSAMAETVEIPVGQQAQQKWTMKRPISGMQQSKVEEFFGQPIDWREAVGDPPISAWIYPEFVVYFEYDHVIHTVLRHQDRDVASNSDVRDEQ